MKYNKHIVILTPGFPTDEQDTTCIPALQDYLVQFVHSYKEIKISIITFEYPFSNKVYHWHGIEVYPCGGKNSKLKKPGAWRRAFLRIINLNKIEKIDLIHSLWYGQCAFFGNLISMIYKLPHVCTLMGQDVLKRNSFAKIINPHRLHTVVLSLNHQEKFEKYFKRKPNIIIPWGISEKEFPQNSIERQYDLIGIGSLIALKNFNLFIDIVFNLKKQKDTINCVIVGGGPQMGELQEKIDSLDLVNNIKLTGHQPRNIVFEYLENSKVFLHTSHFESFGHVIPEALSRGNYVVSFDVGIAREIEKCFVASSQKEAEKRIMQLLNSTDLDFMPVVPYSSKNTAEKYFILYKKLMDITSSKKL